MTMLIKKGQVFLGGKFIKADILIDGSKIAAIGNDLEKSDKVIDGAGKFIVPGLIDMHVHFRDFGEEYKEDWKTGSSAAAAGGITTVFDMPNNIKPIVSVELLNLKREHARNNSLVNFGLYAAVTEDNIIQLNNSAIKYVKLYYGKTTGDIAVVGAEKIFRELRKDILIVVHAEDNSVIEENRRIYTGSEENYHTLIRSSLAESTAVGVMLTLAKKYGRNLHITHVSAKDSVQMIMDAKESGLKITCDTCPHYLFLDDTFYSELGNKMKVNPSIKSKADRDFLWSAIEDGSIDCISSDHAPHTLEEKSKPYNLAPAGIPGVETTVPMMLNAVNENKIKFERFIEIMTAAPAKILGIKNKGKIGTGYDADLTIIDMNIEKTMNDDLLYTKCRWSPYSGMMIKGWPIMTIVNGNIVYVNNKTYSDKKGCEVENG
ncbi:MAG: dihydroorotase family protein [archaeon]